MTATVRFPAAYDPDIAAMRSLPGPLTLSILAVVWERKRADFQSICRGVAERHKPLAQSTISTTLTRLIQRGWLKRVDHNMYVAVISRTELIAWITDLIDSY